VGLPAVDPRFARCHAGPGERVMNRATPLSVPSAALSRFVGAAVTLIVLLVSGTVAEGSCGDWLAGHPRGEAQGQAARLDSPHDDSGREGTRAPLTDIAGNRSRSPADIPRCQGPSCRGVPYVPPVPRDAAGDVPPHDPADRGCPVVAESNGLAGPLFLHADRRAPKGEHAVPIRPPRRASPQA
jgi:hypothetical protein